MCGRYYSLFDKQQVAEHFHVRRTADNVGIIAPNWNVAPGDPQPVIRRSHETNERELVLMRWGIVPWFAKTEGEFKALSTINAKSDRLTDSKMWREPFAKRRCLVPASGLYEWPKEGHAISPTYTPESESVADETPAAFGDLFGTPTPSKPAKKGKASKPIKRVFAITTVEPGPFRLRRYLGLVEASRRYPPRNLRPGHHRTERTRRPDPRSSRPHPAHQGL